MLRPVCTVLLGALGTTAAAAALVACGQPKNDDGAAHPQPAPTASARPPVAAGEPKDAGAAANAHAKADPAAPYDGPMIAGLFRETPVMSEMEWPKEAEKRGERSTSVRIGYIRQGQKVPVLPEPHPKSNCKEGWYELVQGGFVCARYATLDLNHPKVKLAPHAPDLVSGPLPYQYGYNITNGTPLYRTIPSRSERVKLEPWLAPKPKPKPRQAEEDNAVAYGDDVLDAGVPLTLASSTVTATTTDPFGLGEEGLAEATPWYLREHDGGKPMITLDELRGEGPVARRMVKGFYVAIDKELTERGRWWRTTYSLIAPHDRIYLQDKWSRFHGIWLNDDAPADPAAPPSERKPTPNIAKMGSKSQVAIVLYYKASKYTLGPNKKTVTAGESLPRHAVLKLTGESVVVDGKRYEETDEGWWMRSTDATKTDPGPPPRDLAPGEKWIDVNIKTQTLVLYEGDRAVYATAISSGKESKDDPEKDHRTPPGTFRIREKHIAATMDGDVATDGPYSIEDVPWIMYFQGSYALHGAFWHNNFGRRQSHGCVNLAPADAKAIFGWTEPRIPDGWHAAWSTPEKPGTRVVVHCGPGQICEPKPRAVEARVD